MTYYADFSLYDIDEVSEEELADIIDLGSLRQHRSRGWHSCTLCQKYTEHSATPARAKVDYRLGHAEVRAP
ncbi:MULTISPECIES: hypothetical protein [unclassified Streptomyces]|uniref:DUF7919 family protein n=1 Tax=unclassified Streptomyces TaxID=2593676 RepID=UPI003434D7FC